MTEQMTISLIIPAHNEGAYIGACIDSVVEHGAGRFCEIIVIDNASTDCTADIARERPGVRVVREDRKGLTHARERGRLEAKGELLAYIDADCRLPKKWIEVVERVFTEQNTVVALSGPATYFDGRWWQRYVLGACWRVSAPLMYYLVGYMVYGAHFVVRRSALDAIGGFNRGIDFYGEDTELARRLNGVGKVVFRMEFRIVTSARRFITEGMFMTNMRYALNFLWPVLLNRPFSRSYRDVR